MVQKLSTYRRGNTTTTGISTSSNLVIGSDTSTGTADQNLQVSGGTYISGNTGIGSDVPQAKLDVDGNTRIVGILTVGTASSTTTTTIDGSQDFPTIRPTLDLNFAATKTLDRRITFTRDSIGTYTDELGIIRTAPNNVPRFDHDPETGESLGLLIEKSRTNRFVSSIPNAGDWSLTNVGTVNTNTITENYATAPDGTTTATRWQWDIGSTSSDRAILRQGTGSLGSSTLVTLSIYLKSNTGSNQLIALHADGGIYSASVVTVTPEWQRFRYTYTSAIGINNGVEAKGGDGSGLHGTQLTEQGDVLVWGAQMEIGGFPTSYIPTSGSTVTRAQDFAKITGTNFTGFYNQTEGTIFSQHSLIDGVDNNNNCYVYQVDNGTNNEVAFRLIDKNTYYSNPSKLTATSLTSGSSITLLQKSSASSGTTLHSTSYAVKTNNFAGAFDGATVQTDDSGTLPSNQTTLSIGYNSPANTAQLNGHIRKLTYYNKRLTNSQLQSLTRQ